jgi:2-C-methyl-D-erythritol 2,4-cyclodiphosphate synthase
MRIGHGFDAHAFSAERRLLVLGGVAIEYDRGLAGHSDADVALHALIDALLGAAGLGDIGGMFPSSESRWKDASSIDLLRLAGDRVRAAGHTVANADITIVAQAPRLAPYVQAMRGQIAAALEFDITQIGVKASSSDGLGFTGRGEGIAAFAVVLLD